MIYSDEFIEWLREKLGKAELNASGTEIITFCPFCEYDRDRSKHGHLYISVESPEFFCQKCHEGGLLLRFIRILNDDPSKYIKKDVIQYSRTKKIVNTIKDNKFKLPELSDNGKKIEYLQSRIYSNFDYRKIPGLIFSINEFADINNLKLSESEGLLKYLENEFVGFLCNRKNMIIFRNTDKTSNFRYYKMKIIKNNIFQDFYGLKFNNMNSLIPKIVLSEGVFDVLYPATHPDFSNLRKETNVWCAVAGLSSYFHSIKSILDYYHFVKADVVIFSDRGVTENFYRQLLNNPLINKLDVFWNKKEKDFGEKDISIFKKEIKKYNNRRKNYGKSLS